MITVNALTLPAETTLVWLKFSLWLLNWEFSDTILLLTKTKTIFAVSQKKGKLSRAIKTLAKLLREMKTSGVDQSLIPTIVEWNVKTDSVQSVVD